MSISKNPVPFSVCNSFNLPVTNKEADCVFCRLTCHTRQQKFRSQSLSQEAFKIALLGKPQEKAFVQINPEVAQEANGGGKEEVGEGTRQEKASTEKAKKEKRDPTMTNTNTRSPKKNMSAPQDNSMRRKMATRSLAPS